MTPEQTRLLAGSFLKLENRLYELASLLHQRLFEISPESRSLFKGDLEEQKVKMARVIGEFVRLQTRSRHFLPATGNGHGGEIVIPGIGALGARHEIVYGVRARHYGYMREALLYAIRRLLGHDYTDAIGWAWAETFDTLAGAMQKHAGDNPGAVAFAKLFYRKETETAPIITWSDSLSVGIEQIDNEHKRLLVLLNELNRALEAGLGQGALGGVLEGLVHYASYHFAHEEDLFRRSNYPAYEAHLRQHQTLTAKAVQIFTDFQSGTAEVIPGEVLEFLKNWLYYHIMGSDREFGAYLKANPRALRPE